MKFKSALGAVLAAAIWTAFVFFTAYHSGKKSADAYWNSVIVKPANTHDITMQWDLGVKDARPVIVMGQSLYYWHDNAFVCSIDKLVVGTLKPEFDTKEAAKAYVERKTKFICEQGGIK